MDIDIRKQFDQLLGDVSAREKVGRRAVADEKVGDRGVFCVFGDRQRDLVALGEMHFSTKAFSTGDILLQGGVGSDILVGGAYIQRRQTAFIAFKKLGRGFDDAEIAW